MKKPLILLMLTLVAWPAHAAFEGVLHMKLTGQKSDGNVTMYVSKAGSRQEMMMESAKMPFKMTSFMNFKNRNKVIILNDQAKTYSEMDTQKTKERAKQMDNATYTVKKLGTLTIAGLSCTDVLVTSSRGGETEMCTTKELMNYSDYAQLHANDPENSHGDSFLKALKEADADGVPIKTVHKGRGGATTIELVKVEKKSVPASLFEIPPGYTKSEGQGFGAPAGAMPPDAQEQMKKAMEGMTPEQKAMMEKMMKGRQ